MPSDSLDALNAGLAGRYRIERKIGSGGMATVYLAEDLKHQRKVAVKVLLPQLASALGPDRFLREIAIAANLNHPHILALHDSGEIAVGSGDQSARLLFYVMPYITGESLRQRLAREKQLSIEETVRITRQVAAALDYAHGRGVIHRDIKPENILLHEGEAMVADFGIALAVTVASDIRLTGTGVSIGTSEYMSPEQAMGEGHLDSRSDIYSLGCVLFEMLAGEPPYTGPTALAVLAKRLTDPVPSVRRLRSTVSPVVEQALQKALAQAPADRFDSARALADALSQPLPGKAARRAIAVLPFVNLTADPENEYFADGMTEDVIAQLAKIRNLKVISRTSVMQFKKREQSLREIAGLLEASTMLEGSVRRAGNRVRIVAQLIDADNDQHLWAETYDRDITDVFAIQSDVALQIAAALQAELSPDERARIRKEPTSDLRAYQLYLQGRHSVIRYTPESVRKGIELFRQSIARDPNYALAYTALAQVYTELAETGMMSPEEAYPAARDAVANALRIDPELGDAHGTSAFVKFVFEFDWIGAERGFQRALELNPNGADIYDLYGRLCSALGRFDDGITMQQRAYELDPIAHRTDIANAYLRAGRYDEALQAASRATDLDPGYSRAHSTLGWALIKKGRVSEGLGQLELAVRMSAGEPLFSAQLGQAYAETGQPARAREILRELEERASRAFVSPYSLAYVHTGLGEHDRAMDYLERAYRERTGAVYGIKGSFLFAPLRTHPRFTALLKTMNLA
jgi:serine/threonine-protein kinase